MCKKNPGPPISLERKNIFKENHLMVFFVNNAKGPKCLTTGCKMFALWHTSVLVTSAFLPTTAIAPVEACVTNLASSFHAFNTAATESAAMVS